MAFAEDQIPEMRQISIEKISPQSSRTSEEGAVEAALVLIPTTLLFIMVFQLVLAGSWQSLETAQLHDTINRLLISNPDVSERELERALGGAEIQMTHSPQGRVITAVKLIPIPVLSGLLGERASIRAVTVVHSS